MQTVQSGNKKQMTGYLYIGNNIIAGPIKISRYTDKDIFTTDGGRFSDLSQDVELSSTPDLSEHLLSDYRNGSKTPTELQQLRADIDFIAIMEGIDL